MVSILICAVPIRTKTLFTNITDQAKGKDVQVLYLADNFSMSVGEKRNKLIEISGGERIIFVDDDDRVSNDYVDKVLEYSKLDYDCVAIGVEYRQNNTNLKIYDYRYKKNINTRDEQGRNIAGRVPNHLCLWKKDVAKRVEFPSVNLAEDHRWADEQVLLGYSIYYTKDIIYYYDFNRENSLTRMRR